jgi:hypothetical protein
MHALNRAEILCGTLLLAALAAVAGCQTDTTVNTNTTANANTTMNANAAATPMMSAATIETREPEQYKATLIFSATAEGKSQALQLPIEVARSGDNRRYAFNNIPVIGQVIFLDRADKRYLILPTRKQYAEITPELIGFDVRSLTPGQMVVMLQKQQGVERVGEEQRDGREVVKYRYAATTKTGSQAGDVATESFIYVDKETGLPLHADLSGQSSGNVQGVSRARLVADMRDIQTTVDPTLFDLPQGLTKLTEQEIKQQVAVIGQFLQFALGALNSQMGGAGAPAGGMTTMTPPPASGATASPAASPAMSPVASPTR